MRPSIPNAFVRSARGAEADPRASLTRLLAPMRAALHATDQGWSLDLTPMRAVDAASVWAEVCLLRGEQTVVTSIPGASAAAPAGRLEMEPAGAEPTILDHAALPEHAILGGLDGRIAVCVEGPVEAGDVEAITRAVAAGASPLEAELRAVAALRVTGHRSLTLDARARIQATILVAENLRHYVAALRRRSLSDVSRPGLWQVDRLLGDTGTMSIRPIESDRFPTSIDIGINTTTTPMRPANRSIIYDIPSDTWHMED